MASYVPEGRDELDKIASEIAAMFSRAEQSLTSALSTQVAAGLESSLPDVARSIDLASLRRDAEAVVSRLRSATPAEVDRLVTLAREGGAEAAVSELSRLTGTTSPLTTPGVLSGTTTSARVVGDSVVSKVSTASIAGMLTSSPAAVALATELAGSLDDVARNILRWPDDAYRRAVGQSAADVLLGLGTNLTAQTQAWQKLVRQGITGFKDIAGRKWNLATYVETATRTATRRAWDIQHEQTYRELNVELVSIAVGSGACKACSDVAGKVWRVDAGPVGRLKLPSALDGKEVEVNVEGTLDDARSHGWRHPNCRCRPVAYLPGTPLVSDVTTYDPQAEADRAKLRELERKTRQAKQDAAAALTPEDRAKANARVRDLQGQIRTHVDSTGLMRQRNREAINLGKGGLPGADARVLVPAGGGPSSHLEALRGTKTPEELRDVLNKRFPGTSVWDVDSAHISAEDFPRVKSNMDALLQQADSRGVGDYLKSITVVNDPNQRAWALTGSYSGTPNSKMIINTAAFKGPTPDAIVKGWQDSGYVHIASGVSPDVHVATHEVGHALDNVLRHAHGEDAFERRMFATIAEHSSVARAFDPINERSLAMYRVSQSGEISGYGGGNFREAIAEAYATGEVSPSIATPLEKAIHAKLVAELERLPK